MFDDKHVILMFLSSMIQTCKNFESTWWHFDGYDDFEVVLGVGKQEKYESRKNRKSE